MQKIKKNDGSVEFETLVASLDDPYLLEADKLIKKYNVKKRAGEDAIRPFPMPNDTELTELEKSVVADCIKGHGTLVSYVDDSFKKLHDKFKDALLFLNNPDFSDVIRKAKREIGETHKLGFDRLVESKKNVLEKTAQLNFFKSNNQLRGRDADYPESNLYVLGLVFFFMLVEVIANSFFFAEGSDIGLLGGFIEALLVSIGVIWISFFTGLIGLRNVAHVSHIRKTFGALFTAAGLSIVSFSILFAAHFRSNLQINSETARIEAWNSIASTPFAVNDYYSFVLMVIGSLFSGIAIYKGFLKYSDRYPGYEDVDRKKKDSDDDYQQKKENLSKDRYKKADEYIDKINSIVKDTEACISSFDESKNLISQFNRAADQIERSCHAVILKYREENKFVRQLPDPIYWNDPLPNIKNAGINETYYKNVFANRDRFLKNLEILKKKAKEAKNDISEEANALDTKLTEELEKIIEIAKARIIEENMLGNQVSQPETTPLK